MPRPKHEHRYLVIVGEGGFDSGTEASAALEHAYIHIASTLLDHLPERRSAVRDFNALRGALQTVSIPFHESWTSHGLTVPGGREWSRVELENNLRQMEILALALRSEPLARAKIERMSPTQQSGSDAEGTIDDTPFVLEAFGGDDIHSNRKLSKDVAQLFARGNASTRLFFACRKTARGSETPRLRGALFERPRAAPAEGVVLFEVRRAPPQPV
jgi:hypothetical protein